MYRRGRIDSYDEQRDLQAIRDDIAIKAYANNEMRGTSADELLLGTAGPDAICGEWGNDVMKGGRGNDFLEGCWGDDILTGGPGSDVFQFYVYGSKDVITDWEPHKDVFEIAFEDVSSDEVYITQVARGHYVVTVEGHPEFQVDVFGRSFDYSDILYTNYVGYVG